MSHSPGRAVTIPSLGDEERSLVRLAAVIASGDDATIRAQLTESAPRVRPDWIEELILQSYLFAGFPRALNAMREWRRLSDRVAPPADAATGLDQTAEWTARGEETCRVVYGGFYERLRHNVRDLHPALDRWMIVEGYGKVLSRPALDLARRELCVVAACAVTRQDRQLHAHLHGALHAGAAPVAVDQTLDAVAPWLDAADVARYRLLWTRVRSSAAHVH
jgi:4-carboxymuconolactone decarboxylase